MHPFVAEIGPFYDAEGAAAQLGLTIEDLAGLRNSEHVLGMAAGDGTWRYPAWQFTGHGTVHEVLAPVLDALRGLDRWAAGTWLVAPHPEFAGRTARQALADGLDPTFVAQVALHNRTALSS